MSIAGDVVAVGARCEDGLESGNGCDSSSATEDSGAVYMFHKSATEWEEEVILRPSALRANHQFGSRVALSGDRLAASAPLSNTEGLGNSGAVFLFHYNPFLDRWDEVETLTPTDPSVSVVFGKSVEWDGDALAVGAPRGNVGTGLGYTFDMFP